MRRWIEEDNKHIQILSFIFIFKKLITYIEAPYEGLWYAASNPDGFRFGSVNRPPHRLLYTQQSSQRQTSNGNCKEMQSVKCLRTDRPINQRIALLRLPGHPRHLPLLPGPKFFGLGPPTPLSLPFGSVFVRPGVACTARRCAPLTGSLSRMGMNGPPPSRSCGAIVGVAPSPF